MTDLATADALASVAYDLDEPPMVPIGRPGLWRALSMVVVIAAAAVTTVWVLQSRSASDLAARNAQTLDARSTTIVVDRSLPVAGDATIAVLGVDASDRHTLDDGVGELSVPTTVVSMVGVFAADGTLHGLATVPAAVERESITISADSTARAVLMMAPALLQSDTARSLQNVDVIADDPAFDQLVEALGEGPNLSDSNPAVEQALASILGRVPARTPFPDQGCDSVLSNRAYAVAGACATPGARGTTITNEQDRWMLAFAGPEPWGDVCLLVAPAGTPGSEALAAPADCGSMALVVAPGPMPDRSPDLASVNSRVLTATGFEVLASYVAPFVDLAGGGAGVNAESNAHLLGARNEAVTLVEALGESPDLTASLDVLLSSSNALERHVATVEITRALIDDHDLGSVVAGWRADASAHHVLLDFYDRVGERMVDGDRSEWRWRADSHGTVDLGDES